MNFTNVGIGYKAEIICRLTETHNQSLMMAMIKKAVNAVVSGTTLTVL